MISPPRILMLCAAAIAGALVLLEYGADPWLQATSPQGNPMRSYFDSQVSGTMNSVAAEFFFRMIHAGHLTGATPDQLDLIMNTLERYLDQALTSGRERDIYAA